MRIALFTETFLPKIDGIVTRLRFTIRELQQSGDQVLVFAPGDGPTEYEGARVVRLPGMRLPLYPELILSLPLPLIGRELRKFRPDLIHCADAAVLGIGGIYYAHVLGSPLVISYHTRIPKYAHYYHLGPLEPLGWWLLQLRHRTADLNLCTSPAMQLELEAHGIKRLRIWPPAVDTEAFHPRFRSAAVRDRLTAGRPDEPLLLYVGRVSAEKNIEAIRSVLQALPRVRLAILGDGPHRGPIEKHFAGTNTVFTGYLRGRELAEAIASADILALPSKTETLGMVLLEAMAAGTVVVAANAGGIPHVVEHGVTGMLFEPHQPGSLAETVVGLLDHTIRLAAIREQARRRVEGWSWRASTDRLRQYYEEAIANPRSEKLFSPFLYGKLKKAVTTTLRTILP